MSLLKRLELDIRCLSSKEFISEIKNFPNIKIISEDEEHIWFKIKEHKNDSFGYTYIYDSRKYGYKYVKKSSLKIKDIFDKLNDKQKKFIIYNLELFSFEEWRQAIFTTSL